MLLTITTTRQPATDLGYLLGKHPGRLQTFEVPGGKAHVFYSEASPERCTAALLLDLDPVTLTRQETERANEFALKPYVNDRPYIASSWLATAIAKVFASAMNGRCRDFPDMPAEEWPFRAVLSAAAGSDEMMRRLFEPLGFTVEIERGFLDEKFPAWGPSRYARLTLEKTCRLADLLSQLYILIPVLDFEKHYFLSEAEAQKLLEKGGDWLKNHPSHDFIVRRYLQRGALIKSFNLLKTSELADTDEAETAQEISPENVPAENAETKEKEIHLHELRLRTAFERVKNTGAKSVLDLGCGEGRLLRMLLDDRQFQKIVGMDVSQFALDIAGKRLKIKRLDDRDRDRIQLLQGSATYRDRRMEGFDAAVLVEVVEHLEPHRLPAFERSVFEFARPKTVVVTTPRADFNEIFGNEDPNQKRHPDHRFEWTEAEFQSWASDVAGRFGYAVAFEPVGEEILEFGAPSQMGVFRLT